MTDMIEAATELARSGYSYMNYDHNLLLNALSARGRLIATQRLESTWNVYNRVWRAELPKSNKSSLFTQHCLGVIDDFYGVIHELLNEGLSHLGRRFSHQRSRALMQRTFTRNADQTADLHLAPKTLGFGQETFLTVYFGGMEAEVLLSTEKEKEFMAAPPRGSALVFFGSQAPNLLGIRVPVPTVHLVPPCTGSYLVVRIANEEVALQAASEVVPLRRRHG